MFNIVNIIRKRNFLKKTEYLSDDSAIIFGKNVEIFSEASSKIKLNGTLTIGMPLTGLLPGFSHREKTIISIGRNSNLIIHDDVKLAPGTTIRIGDNATLELMGKNFIAHDTILIITRKATIGKNSSISWNCTLIDDDAHSFYKDDGRKIKRIRKDLLIGANVGIQMNVTIPSGGSIGDNSIVSANTVVRSDVPENSLIYSTVVNKTLPNITTGFQFNELE
jgi:acetyltransferase-like isoleucine patch superfamily enzyme